jgi:hypothetical protein
VIHLLTLLACTLAVAFAAARLGRRRPVCPRRLETAYLRYEGERVP